MPDWTVEFPARYSVTYDQMLGVFRVLDCWHESIKNISDLTQEVPDNSPAVKILNTMEINALLGKLRIMGWLEKYANIEGTIPASNIPRSKTIHEIAVENIADIAKINSNSSDPNVSKEAILAIREVVSKI